MITCPACGKENEDVAAECKRCRAPLREDASADEGEAARAFGTICARCDTYNEPGVERCTACGYKVSGEKPAAAPVVDQNLDDPSAGHTSEELRALAISPEEAAEAMDPRRRESPAARTLTPPPAEAPSMKRMGALPRSLETESRSTQPPPSPPPARPANGETAAPAEKPCTSCGAINPPAARFCFDCGNPFIQKKPAAAPLKIEPLKPTPPPVAEPPSIEVDAELTQEMMPVDELPPEPTPEEMQAEPAPEELPPEPLAEELPTPDEVPPEEIPVDSADVAEPIIEEIPPPFQATLVVEKGGTPGSAFKLDRLENRLGADGGQVQITEDPYIAPHAATLLFAEDRLFVRDEGSANGVFVKVRDSAPLEPGDLFVAGERMFRYDGAVELPRAQAEGDTPFLGAPRPQGPTIVRLVEVLAGGKTGRTCHRSGPAIAIGRSGCEMNFPTDTILGARHAEVRIGEDGSAQLVDLGQGPSGVFVRIRPQQTFDLQAGDVLQVGDQQLRLDVV